MNNLESRKDTPEYKTHIRFNKLDDLNDINQTQLLWSMMALFLIMAASFAMKSACITHDAFAISKLFSWIMVLSLVFEIYKSAIRCANIDMQTQELRQQQMDLCELRRGYLRNAVIVGESERPNGVYIQKIYQSVTTDIARIIK